MERRGRNLRLLHLFLAAQRLGQVVEGGELSPAAPTSQSGALPLPCHAAGRAGEQECSGREGKGGEKKGGIFASMCSADWKQLCLSHWLCWEV